MFDVMRCIKNTEKLGYPIPIAFMEMLEKSKL